MLKEIDCPIEERVLPIIAIGTEEVLPSKESVESKIFIDGQNPTMKL